MLHKIDKDSILLPEVLDALSSMTQIDFIDWQLVCSFAEKWKISIADTLLDLNFVEETVLAKALAKAHNLKYEQACNLKWDFSDIDFEILQDLLSVGAIPLIDDRLAVCNPYDDLYGNLGAKLCKREIIVTERTALFEILRKQGLNECLGGNEL